jgi:hypothetical protein
MDTINAIFFYQSFLCMTDRQGQWEIHCLNYRYTYTSEGTRKDAKNQVDYFLKLRYEKDEQP